MARPDVELANASSGTDYRQCLVNDSHDRHTAQKTDVAPEPCRRGDGGKYQLLFSASSA